LRELIKEDDVYLFKAKLSKILWPIFMIKYDRKLHKNVNMTQKRKYQNEQLKINTPKLFESFSKKNNSTMRSLNLNKSTNNSTKK